MPWRRVLSLLRPPPGPVALAGRLGALGLQTATELAVLEWRLMGSPGQRDKFLTAWPSPPGMDRPQPDTAAEVERDLRKRGLLEKRGKQVLPAARVRAVLGPYLRLEPAGGGPVVLHLDRAIEEVRLEPGADYRSDAALGLLSLAGRASALVPGEAETLAAELDGCSPQALGITAALAGAALDHGAVANAMDARLAELRASLARVAVDDQPPRALLALRLLVLRFASHLGGAFDPAWLVVRPGKGNPMRREELCRAWAWYAGLQVQRHGEIEAPATQVAGLLRVDSRRAARLDAERAHQDRVVAGADELIKRELKAREDRAKAYASGRRE